ncbi:helix-turn-helix domain-containing protein [Streptomyces gardneri]|nr:helix-turn-helix domain-containing protein [Streptomyces gardneri]
MAVDGSWLLNRVVELRTLFEGLPTPVRRSIELVVFGGDLPRADVSGMRWVAAELRAKAAAMNGHADDAKTLLAEEDSLGALGDRVREILDLHREGAARLREEALALADQAHAAANDAEKTLCVMFAFGVELAWRIFRTLAAAAAAGPAAQVAAAPVVESMLVEGRGRVALMRAGLEQAYKVGAASTAARLSALGPARFAVTVGTAAALPAGVDLGVQLAQVASGDRNSTVKGPNGENPRGIDLKSVAAAGVSGAGGALGGIAAGMVAPKVFPRLETSRWALGLVQGVAGAVSGLGAAALITGWPEHYEDVLASLLSGGFAGVVDVHRGGHSDLGSPVGKVVDGSVAHVPPDPSTVSLSKDAVMRLTGAPQGTKSLVPAPPAPVDNTGGITPQPANPASPGPATGAGASQAEENSVSSRPPGATGDGQHEPDEAGDRLRHLADSGSGERAPASDAHANGQAGTAGQPGDSNSPARQGDRAAADRVGDRARGDDGAHGGDMHNDGGAQAGSAGISQTRDGGQADSGGGAQAGNGQAGGGAHGASGGNGQPGGGAHGAGAGAGAQAGRGLASGAVLSSAGGDHSDSGPRQSGDHGEGDAHVTGRGRNVWAPAGDGAAGHEPAVSRPGPGSAKVDPPVEVGDAGSHGASDEGPARVTAPKQTDLPPAHEPSVEHSEDAAPTDARPSVHDGPDRLVGELAQELVGLPSADPATKRDLTAEQQAQFKAAAKKALTVYRLRQEELAGESWEQRRHAMEHGDRVESLLRYIDAVRAGTGKTPRWNQIKAFLLGEHGFMRQMGTGQGKSMVGALDTLWQLSRGEPVEAASGNSVRVHHVITTTEVLANEGVREFAPMLRGLGYEVARWDPHDPPGETQRPTVYYMTYDERATAELFDRPPPGKTATIDEADAVLVHNQTVHYQSEGQREIASEVEAAGVHRVRDFLKAVLRSRITAAKDLSMHLEEALHDGPLTAEEAGAVRALSAVEVGAARTLTARLLREQPEQCLDTVSRLWESYAGRKFTAEETEMARAFLDVKAGRLKLDRDFQIFGEDSDKKVQILDEYGKPRSDPKIGTESRWFGGRHKMVEAMFGAPVYSDGTGSKKVTVEDVLGRYEHLHLMSGTLERTAAEIKENFPVEGGLAKVEDFGRSKLAGEQDRIFLTEPEKLRDAVGRVRQLQAAGRPVLVICPFNDLARKFSLMLTKAGVEHNSIDARWFAEHRDNNAAEEHLLSVKDTAGVRGAVTVGTGMLGRGFDVSISDEVNELGGVHAHMLGRSPTNPDEDHQWSARAGRNGRNGSFCFNVAASDRLYSEAQQQGARVAVTHYRAAVAKHAEATAEYTETVRQVGDPDAAQPQKSVQAARTKVAATAADVAAAEREMRSLTTPLQNDAADRTYLQRAMRRANQAHAPPAAEDLAATSPQSTVAADLLHTGPGTAHAAAGVDPTGADPGRTRSDTGHAGADKDRVVMEAVHVGPDAVQPHLRGDRFARLAGWLGIPASVQAAAAMFDTDDDDDPLSRLLERAGVSSAAVEALNQHLDHAAPAVVMRADTLSDEQALNHLMPQRNRLAAELGWEPAQVAGAEGVRQVGAAVDTARKELADLLDVPATEVNTATARDGLADAVARLLAPTETADDPATELLVLAASTYLAVTALLDLAVAIHQRSPKSCVNNGVTMMRVLYPDSEHAYHLPDDMPLRGHDEEDTERAFGGAFRAFGSLDAAAESLKDRPGGSQALVYRWMNKGEVESHLVLLVNDSDRADAPNLVVLDIAAAPGETPITPADLAGRPALLNKAVPFQQWRREQQAFIDRLKEADRAVFAIEFDNKGQPLARLSATQRSAVASRDPGLPPPSLWSSRAPPLRRKMFALAGARPPGDGPSPDSSVPADTTEPDTQSLNVDSGSAMPHDDPESRGTDAGSMQGRVGSRPPAGRDRESTWSAGTAPLDFRTTRAEVHARTGAEVGDGLATLETFVAMRDGAPVHPGGGADAGDLTDEQMAGPALVPEQLLLTQEHADALSDALTERDQAVDRITDQVCELEHVLAALVGESGTVDMVSLTGVRDELNTFLDQQLAAYAETPEGRRDQMIATLRQVTAKPRLDYRDIRVLNEIMPAKHGGLAALLPGARNRYAQALHTAARVRLAELDSHRVDAFRVDDAMRRLQRGIRGQLDHAAEVLFERGSRRTVQGLLDDIDSMRSKISAARRNISAGWHDIPGDGLAPLLSEIARGLRTRDDVVEAVAAIAAPRHIAVIVDDALRMVEQSAVGIFAESSMRGFVFRDQEARRVRALEETVARVRTTVGIPQTAPDLYTRVVDKSAEHRSDLSTFVDPADTLYLHFTPNIRAIATAGMIRSGAHDEIINTTAGHSLGVHFIKPGNWQGTENFNMYVGYAGLRRTLATGNGTVLPDPLGAIVVMPLGAITKTTPIRNEAKTTAPDEAHLASDATFRPLDGNPSYAYPLDDAYIIPCYSNLQVPQEQRLIIDPDTGERNVRPIAEPIRDAFRRAGYEEAWIDRHVIELPERIAADPDTRVLHGEYDRTKRLIRQAQDEIKRRMAEDGTYTDRLVVPLTTEHGRQFETLDLHGTTRQGYHSTSALAIERLIVTDRRPPVGDAEKPRSERTRWTRSDQPDRAPDQQEQRTRPHGLDGPIGSRPSSDVTASEQNRPTPWRTARTEPDQPPIPPASPGDSVPGEDTTGPGEFIGSRPPSPGEAAGRPTPWARHTVPEALIEQPDGSAPAAWPTPNGTEPFRRWSKDARLARGLTQAQLAARMGVPNSATYIGSLEREATITRDMAVRLLEGLGAPAEVAESVLREYFPDEHGEFPDPRSDRFRHPKDWIIAARTSKGLSRRELAARASVGLTGLSQEERAESPRGEFGMNPDYALRLLAGLDAPGDIATAFMSRFYPDWEAAARADGPRSGGPDAFIGSRPTGFTPEPGDRQQPAEDLTTRDEPTRPDPVHATREELAEWATQLSDHGLRTFLNRAQTETSAHIADVHRGQSPALEAAIATARVQTVLVIEQLHRSAAGGSGSLLAAADAATNVFEVIGALHLADTRSASYTHDLDVLTRFPERLRAVAELGAARFVDGSDWARVADECLLAGRDNGWDEELIQSLRALPAQATEFAAALTGSDRIFGDAGGRYIPNAYRAAMYYLTRSHDTDEAINRLRELDHAVAAAVVRLGSTRPATEAGLSLFQLRLDIHAAIASADGAVAPAMRSSAMRGLDHDPLLPQTIERIVLDLGALARHGSETPRSIRPTYTAYPIASEYLVGASDEDIFPVIEALAFAMHGGDFIKSTGPSSELLRTGSDGVSFVMDQWGRFLAAIDHNSLLHLMSAMGDELAGWGTLFTDQNGRLDDPVRPYRVDEIFDPMGTAQLRDALTRGGLRLDDTNFDNASQGKLWRHDSTPVSALFTMEPLGFLGSIESMFAAYDDGFWIKPVRGGTTRSADEVRVPLILGPLRHEPGNIEVAVYRQGDHMIVRYRDPDPGPEPDRVAPVFAEFHQRMNRWVTESDGVEWHPDTAQVVHTFEQHLGRSVSGQDGPDGYIGSRPSDSAADSNDPMRRSSVVFGPDAPTSQIRASLTGPLSSLGLDAASVEPAAGLLDIAACLVNYGIAAADGDSVKLLLSSRGSDKGFTVSGALSGSTVVRARRALESELLGKGFGTFEWRGRAGETDSWLVHLWGDRKSIVHVDPAQLAGLAEDFGADQVGSAVSAAVGRASRRWGGLKHTGSLAVELNDGRLRVRMLGIRLVDGLAYEPPTLFDETITRPGADRPGGFIGSRPSDSADAAGLSADLARNRADAAAQLRAAAQRFGEEPPVRGAEAAAIEAWQHARKASAATIATLTGTNPGLVMTQLSEVLNLLHRRLTALTQPEWDRLLSSGGQQLSTALGPWIGRSLRLEDDLQRATTLALEGAPDNALNNSNAERRTQRTRDLDDMLGRSATSSGVAANAGMDLPQALERLAASMEETPTGRLLNALLDHVRFARLIQLTTTWMELDGYITTNFGRFETPEQSGGSSPEEGDRTSGLIGNRPQDQPGDAGPNSAEKSTPWSRSSNRPGASDQSDSPHRPEPSGITSWSRPTDSASPEQATSIEFSQQFFPKSAAGSGTDEPSSARPPDFIGNRPPDDETTSLGTEIDKVAQAPSVKRIQTMQGRPGVTIELLTFDNKEETQVLREIYDDADQAMAEWTKAKIGRAMGAPIADVLLDRQDTYHVLYRDYVLEGARNNPRAVDLLGIFAAITGKTSPFAAAFVRDVGGRRVWQDHHLGRQDIVEIGQLVKSVGDSLAQIPFPPSISRTVLDTQMAAMSALREVAQHAEHPLRMAGLDEEAQAKTRLVANFELDHPYIELSGLVSPHIPADTVGEILDKLDDLLGKYRYAPGFRKLMTKIRVLKIDFVAGARAIAIREYVENDPALFQTILTFSLPHAADRMMTLADSDFRRLNGMHPSSAQIYADDVCHEFAHAIDQATNYALSKKLAAVLIAAHGKLELYGLTESYVEWRSRLPSFAFEDSTKTKLNYPEAIAVGFADAEINGAIVGTPQWVIHHYVTTLQRPEIKRVHFAMYQQGLPDG